MKIASRLEKIEKSLNKKITQDFDVLIRQYIIGKNEKGKPYKKEVREEVFTLCNANS